MTNNFHCKLLLLILFLEACVLVMNTALIMVIIMTMIDSVINFFIEVDAAFKQEVKSVIFFILRKHNFLSCQLHRL